MKPFGDSPSDVECARHARAALPRRSNFEAGAGATIIQFRAWGARGADRANGLVRELDSNAATKEHDMRQL
jgi:hypothetical protein